MPDAPDHIVFDRALLDRRRRRWHAAATSDSPRFLLKAIAAEKAFGEAAERWGVGEINFTFAGREPKRSRCCSITASKTRPKG